MNIVKTKKIEFSHAQIEEKGRELAGLLGKIALKQEEKKSVALKFKADISDLQSTAIILTNEINDGFVLVDVECEKKIDHRLCIRHGVLCEKKIDYVSDTVSFIDVNTGEVIEEREIHEDEMSIVG